jgi:hypothetical protein
LAPEPLTALSVSVSPSRSLSRLSTPEAASADAVPPSATPTESVATVGARSSVMAMLVVVVPPWPSLAV